MEQNNPEKKRRIVLVDRDGTLNVEKHYLSNPDDIQLLPGVGEGVRRLREAELPVVVVTNQSGIARGYFTEDTLRKIHHRLLVDLAHYNTTLDAIYYCGAAGDSDDPDRKPNPGMALKAAEKFNADLTKSFMVGDKPADIQLGKNVGAKTILVKTGYGEAYDTGKHPAPDAICETFADATAQILKWIAEDK